MDSAITNDDYGELAEPGTIRFERVLPGPIERVWAYLTDSEKRGRWLASGELEPRVGGAVTLHFRHAELTPHEEATPGKYRHIEHGASFTGRVTACEPPRLLAYTWAEESGSDSEVTFELTPRDDGTVQLVLTHRRLDDPGLLVSVASGWHTHLGILSDHLKGHTPRPFWSTHAKLEADYGQRLAP